MLHYRGLGRVLFIFVFFFFFFFLMGIRDYGAELVQSMSETIYPGPCRGLAWISGERSRHRVAYDRNPIFPSAFILVFT